MGEFLLRRRLLVIYRCSMTTDTAAAASRSTRGLAVTDPDQFRAAIRARGYERDQDFAHAARVSAGYLSLLLAKQRRCRPATAQRILAALNRGSHDRLEVADLFAAGARMPKRPASKRQASTNERQEVA